MLEREGNDFTVQIPHRGAPTPSPRPRSAPRRSISVCHISIDRDRSHRLQSAFSARRGLGLDQPVTRRCAGQIDESPGTQAALCLRSRNRSCAERPGWGPRSAVHRYRTTQAGRSARLASRRACERRELLRSARLAPTVARRDLNPEPLVHGVAGFDEEADHPCDPSAPRASTGPSGSSVCGRATGESPPRAQPSTSVQSPRSTAPIVSRSGRSRGGGAARRLPRVGVADLGAVRSLYSRRARRQFRAGQSSTRTVYVLFCGTGFVRVRLCRLHPRRESRRAAPPRRHAPEARPTRTSSTIGAVDQGDCTDVEGWAREQAIRRGSSTAERNFHGLTVAGFYGGAEGPRWG